MERSENKGKKKELKIRDVMCFGFLVRKKVLMENTDDLVLKMCLNFGISPSSAFHKKPTKKLHD